jgi:AraC family transcriptional regulator of adaptative response/methylated-DNA-[protein]-cysteine methyltransferase
MNQTIISERPSRFEEAPFEFARIVKAIGFLHEHFQEQPDLAAAARAVHLSEYHFQRLFTQWAGISPKRFLQFLTVEHAKRQLAESKAVLAAALEAGLSGPGRLHDLFVSVEAVTPGEFKSRGAGIEVGYGFHETPFGLCLLGLTERGVCWLSFVQGDDKEGALRELSEHWSGARIAEQTEATASVANQVFGNLNGEPKSSLSLLLMGTNFQLKVWQALLKVPAGALVSYKTVGGLIGAPRAERAIGSAVGSNAIAYLIPCHRVIRESGVLGGYRWGESRKQALIGWEAVRGAGGLNGLNGLNG